MTILDAAPSHVDVYHLDAEPKDLFENAKDYCCILNAGKDIKEPVRTWIVALGLWSTYVLDPPIEAMSYDLGPLIIKMDGTAETAEVALKSVLDPYDMTITINCKHAAVRDYLAQCGMLSASPLDVAEVKAKADLALSKLD